MNLNIDIKGLSDIEKIVNANAITKAIARSLNRAATSAFNAGSKKIRERYNIKAKDIKKASKVKKATAGSDRVIITITGGAIPMKYFSPKQTKKGVSVKILKRGKRSLLKHAFIAGYVPIKTKTGKYKILKKSSWGGGHVFIRKTKKRLPIAVMKATAITIPKLFSRDDVADVVKKTATETFLKEFWRNYDYYRKSK